MQMLGLTPKLTPSLGTAAVKQKSHPSGLVMGLCHPLMTFRVTAVAHSGTAPAPKVAMALARTTQDEAVAGAGGEDEAGEGVEVEEAAATIAVKRVTCHAAALRKLTLEMTSLVEAVLVVVVVEGGVVAAAVEVKGVTATSAVKRATCHAAAQRMLILEETSLAVVVVVVAEEVEGVTASSVVKRATFHVTAPAEALIPGGTREVLEMVLVPALAAKVVTWRNQNVLHQCSALRMLRRMNCLSWVWKRE